MRIVISLKQHSMAFFSEICLGKKEKEEKQTLLFKKREKKKRLFPPRTPISPHLLITARVGWLPVCSEKGQEQNFGNSKLLIIAALPSPSCELKSNPSN